MHTHEVTHSRISLHRAASAVADFLPPAADSSLGCGDEPGIQNMVLVFPLKQSGLVVRLFSRLIAQQTLP